MRGVHLNKTIKRYSREFLRLCQRHPSFRHSNHVLVLSLGKGMYSCRILRSLVARHPARRTRKHTRPIMGVRQPGRPCAAVDVRSEHLYSAVQHNFIVSVENCACAHNHKIGVVLQVRSSPLSMRPIYPRLHSIHIPTATHLPNWSQWPLFSKYLQPCIHKAHRRLAERNNTSVMHDPI